MRVHTAGENASALIYACAAADYQAINRDEYDIVAVTGNSMGWYIALAVAGALNPKNAIHLINTMGSMMTAGVVGGQLIYPVVDDNWQLEPQLFQQIDNLLKELNQQPEVEVYISIKLGGYLVFGGNKAGLKALEQVLPVKQDRYPMNLFNHAAFHTPLLTETSNQAKQLLGAQLFQSPKLPIIDGMGQIWQPYSTDVNKLYDYTLGHQVTDYYDFSKAVEVAIKEFNPDKLIILGPGSTLGGAIGQVLLQHNWLGLQTKADFIQRQKTDPFLLAMGITQQRTMVV